MQNMLSSKHVLGENDQLIPPQSLAKYLQNCLRYSHFCVFSPQLVVADILYIHKLLIESVNKIHFVLQYFANSTGK